jgi:hypothetical protein
LAIRFVAKAKASVTASGSPAVDKRCYNRSLKSSSRKYLQEPLKGDVNCEGLRSVVQRGRGVGKSGAERTEREARVRTLPQRKEVKATATNCAN